MEQAVKNNRKLLDYINTRNPANSSLLNSQDNQFGNLKVNTMPQTGENSLFKTSKMGQYEFHNTVRQNGCNKKMVPSS